MVQNSGKAVSSMCSLTSELIRADLPASCLTHCTPKQIYIGLGPRTSLLVAKSYIPVPTGNSTTALPFMDSNIKVDLLEVGVD